MRPTNVPVIFILLLLYISSAELVVAATEEWGYVEVRQGAHMFWWYYRSPNRVDSPSAPWPTVMWLQGGPGSSGTGLGNFLEIGPLDGELKPRNSTWLQLADLLFVDCPVGTGFSYVEKKSLLVHTDEEAGNDLTILLKAFFNGRREVQKSPLYVVAESYGGKFAVTLGLSVLRAVRAGELKLKLGGIALGNSWMSPEDFVSSWAPLLKDLSRLDENGVEKSNRMVEVIRQQLGKGQYEKATLSWILLEKVIDNSSNFVDFYNFLLDQSEDTLAAPGASLAAWSKGRRYSTYLRKMAPSILGSVDDLMNGVIRKKLRIIPQNVKWGGQGELVFTAFYGDFMKPRIEEVDELLAEGVNITIYNGQLDLICATKGVDAWIEKLKWEGLKKFQSLDRTPLYCGSKGVTKAFRRSYKNLHFYWILSAGHFVPVEQPCIALKMLREITSSPSRSP